MKENNIDDLPEDGVAFIDANIHRDDTYSKWVTGKLSDSEVTFVDIDIDVGSARKVRNATGQLPTSKEVVIGNRTGEVTDRGLLKALASIDNTKKGEAKKPWEEGGKQKPWAKWFLKFKFF